MSTLPQTFAAQRTFLATSLGITADEAFAWDTDAVHELMTSSLIKAWRRDVEKADEAAAKLSGKTLADYMAEHFPDQPLEDYTGLVVMLTPTGRLVSFGCDL